jgi:hypothetical protein
LVRIAPKITEGKAMSALAMILMAAMVVPGDVPEKVSGEVSSVEKALLGEWKGTWEVNGKVLEVQMEIEKGWVGYLSIGVCARSRTEITDVGSGKFKLRWFSTTYLGIYKQEEDKVVLCLRRASRGGYPTSFRAEDRQELYILHRILHRVKSGK